MEPSRHTAQGRNESGVPLGGIGAGKIEFCADGRFTNVTTNNWDCPIIDGAARTPFMPRIKEGFEGSVYENAVRRRSLFSAEGLPGFGWQCTRHWMERECSRRWHDLHSRLSTPAPSSMKGVFPRPMSFTSISLGCI